MDLDTGAVVAAELHPADEGDTTTLSKTLAKAEANLEAVDAVPTSEDPAECVADKGYHSRAVARGRSQVPQVPSRFSLIAVALDIPVISANETTAHLRECRGIDFHRVSSAGGQREPPALSVNDGEKMNRRSGVKMYHELVGSLSR